MPSPSIGFLGTPSLTRLSSSFLSSSLTRRHTPESLAAVTKPLLPTVDDEKLPQQRRSSHSLLPPLPSRRSSYIKKDEKPTKVSHEVSIPRQSSYAQAVLNGKFLINILMVSLLHKKCAILFRMVAKGQSPALLGRVNEQFKRQLKRNPGWWDPGYRDMDPT